MASLDSFLFLADPASDWRQMPLSASLFAYGPAPQMELIPYFLSLLTWASLSFGAILLWPISKLLPCIWRAKVAADAKHETEPTAASVPEGPTEGVRVGTE